MSVSRIFACFVVVLALFSCGRSGNQFPHTGDEIYEALSGSFQSRGEVVVGEIYYVSTARLRVRSGDEILSGNILGILERNDRVRVIKASGVIKESFVEIEIVSTSREIEISDLYYVSFNYLSTEKTMATDSYSGDFFMIQNIATEKLRVYRRICRDGSCPHKMIVEANMAAGEDAGGRRTILGSFRITKWVKFYQDGAGRYPSWYHSDYHMPPPPGSWAGEWTRSRYMPGGKGIIRGAFGWYTAHVGPNSACQWTHGTIGWGSDKLKFIWQTRTFFANLFTDPRSHGCSRVDNESIAYLRQLLSVGTPVVKVYVKEGYADVDRIRYGERRAYWNYVLTTRGAREDGQKADREEVLAFGVSDHDILEEGTYAIDKYPNAKPFGKDKGNLYGLRESDMRGVLLVDEGQLVNYYHPPCLQFGGYRDEPVPSYMVSQKKLTQVKSPIY